MHTHTHTRTYTGRFARKRVNLIKHRQKGLSSDRRHPRIRCFPHHFFFLSFWRARALAHATPLRPRRHRHSASRPCVCVCVVFGRHSTATGRMVEKRLLALSQTKAFPERATSKCSGFDFSRRKTCRTRPVAANVVDNALFVVVVRENARFSSNVTRYYGETSKWMKETGFFHRDLRLVKRSEIRWNEMLFLPSVFS